MGYGICTDCNKIMIIPNTRKIKLQRAYLYVRPALEPMDLVNGCPYCGSKTFPQTMKGSMMFMHDMSELINQLMKSELLLIDLIDNVEDDVLRVRTRTRILELHTAIQKLLGGGGDGPEEPS